MYANGGKGYFDAVGIHPYTFSDANKFPSAGNSRIRDITTVRSIMARNGDGGKRVWLTEYGAPSGTAADSVGTQGQATSLARFLQLASTLPGIGPVYSTPFATLAPTQQPRGQLRDCPS